MEAKFTDAVKEVISFSREEAIRIGNDFIGIEHLILAIFTQGKNGAITLLNDLEVNGEELKQSIEFSLRQIGKISKEPSITGSIPLTKQCEKVLKITYLEAKIFRSEFIGTIHLLLSTSRDEDAVTS